VEWQWRSAFIVVREKLYIHFTATQ
jgi:hypothetical protein